MKADEQYMLRALALAERGVASTDPNPAVGCVLVNDGRIVGEGFTQRAGGNHAEVEAIRAAGRNADGATAYVSLEPCAHTGRTGPCARALIDANVARVVFAVEDPNPSVAGGGARMLAAAGVEVATPLLADAARAINRGYFSRIERGRPWMRLKMAASLDGRTALANGASQWITGEAARRDVHRWRARASAVLTGIGTVLADDPSLTARIEDADIDIVQPERVIVDSALRTPAGARLFSGGGRVVIFSGVADGAGPAALTARGARLITVDTDPRCDLDEVVAHLAALELNDVWVEAGPTLSGALLDARLVDELVLYYAPCLLGHDARPLFELERIDALGDRMQLDIETFDRIGDDLRIIARPRSA